VTAAADDTVILGMPHLAIGISATWLLKERGHRHWRMLAKASGRSVPEPIR
jgi:probable biosynthetic protein (TIGR04098 family)